MKIIKSYKTVLLLILTLLLNISFSGCIETARANEQYSNTNLDKYEGKAIFMHVGSPLILAGEDVSFLDPEDFDIAATVYNRRTLIPLRAVAEYLGGTVSYDAKKREAAVSYKGKNYVFPIGRQEALIEESGEVNKITMDTKAVILRNRTMVPVRIICEQLFGKNVDYNNGVIMISDDQLPLSKNTGLIADVKSKIGMATKAKSDEQLNAIMQGRLYRQNNKERRGIFDVFRYGGGDTAAAKADVNGNVSISESMAVDMNMDSDDYSSTNIQVKGIDEADIVKTDGKYIYYSGSNAVRIIKAEGSKMTETSVIKLSGEKYIQEIYLAEDRLILLGNRNQNESEYSLMMPRGGSFSFADVYDVSDPKMPKMLKGHEMEGQYQTSRKSGDNIYLITNTGWYDGRVRPLMKDTVNGSEMTPIELSDIMVMPEPPNAGYVVLSAIDITDDSKTEVEAVTAFGSNVYMNESSLYIAADGNNELTNITKFSIDGMNIGYAGSGKVKGSLLNQFSMDEFEGNLRVATTHWQDGNNLFILNGSLNVVGSVTGLAKGETIYSVRFMGEKGYVVTFRTIDPLFVFDLSDPEAPKITGELKIPGFSNYLHPVGENLILGIGMETRELFERDAQGRDTPVGFTEGGIKISLFDVSDMGKPKEIDNFIIGESGSHSEALYNHKAVMVDENAQQIAFDIFLVKDKEFRKTEQGASVISYKDKNIEQKAFLKANEQEVYGKFIPNGRRVIYIGDTLYYIQDGIINAYDYDNFEKVGSITLK
ncbi:MAG TPA: beta-propeller domain-containing protein [Anaerovoracaceae bacterium]|nr:beta-propeller domain-containing protein [Anaerovoracaceae bacterium]